MSNGSNSYNIYIPIWLDLLFKTNNNQKHRRKNLHSNMVRFIIGRDKTSIKQVVRIYIPIWLDLLSASILLSQLTEMYLHSNMVRFIIQVQAGAPVKIEKFTFQYG